MNGHEIHCGLRQPPNDEFPHEKQPKIGLYNGGEYGGEVQQVGGARGMRDAIVWVSN